MENMEIIMPIGISGSGKSRLYRMRYSDYTLVSPDLIRKELTGNISDQSQNTRVFKEVDRRIQELENELREAKRANEILKDALGFFAESRRK